MSFPLNGCSIYEVALLDLRMNAHYSDSIHVINASKEMPGYDAEMNNYCIRIFMKNNSCTGG